MDKKGQSALEYLMTYGWALVVIVIVIAALVFLIQPSQVGGNTCSTTSGILITNHQLGATPDYLRLILSNGAAATLSNVGVTVSGTTSGVANTGLGTITSLGTTTATFDVPLDENFDAGQYSLTVTFNYADKDGLDRTVTSTCNGTSS